MHRQPSRPPTQRSPAPLLPLSSLLRRFALGALLVPFALLTLPAFADEGWDITRFDVAMAVNEDGSVDVEEAIDVDFNGLERHGIFRYVPFEYVWEPDPTKVRIFDIDLASVTDDEGDRIPVDVSRTGGNQVWRIGDPDVTIDGEQSYRITYEVSGALNPFDDHDELFWNVTGNDWPVPIDDATATVTLPEGVEVQRVACYIGPVGSREECGEASIDGDRATFAARRVLDEGEGMTIVVGLPKGAIDVRPPILGTPSQPPEEKTLVDFLGPNPVNIGIAVLSLLAVLAYLVRSWYTSGRDRRYASVYHLTQDPTEANQGALAGDETIVVEYAPPEDLRPAELGVVLDERAHTRDVTATILDLATRGYLSIHQEDEDAKEYELRRLKDADEGLLPYERQLFEALFRSGDSIDLSDLKNKFYKDLGRVQESLYDRTLQLNHFQGNPSSVRNRWALKGVFIAFAGMGIGVLAALVFGAGLVGAGLILGGGIVAVASQAMPARTAHGREIYRRALGFKKFIEVADKSRQQFYEQAGIFEKYLPYAIMYGSVKKWAGVFEQLGVQVQPPSYYHGYSGAWVGFSAANFADSISSFDSRISSSIASTPGGSGSSGFGGGGSSGGGGGGGGGGSW